MFKMYYVGHVTVKTDISFVYNTMEDFENDEWSDTLGVQEKKKCVDAIISILPTKGFDAQRDNVEIVNVERDTIMNPHTLEPMYRIHARYHYTVRFFETNMQLNKFKIMHPDIIKICKVEEISADEGIF